MKLTLASLLVLRGLAGAQVCSTEQLSLGPNGEWTDRDSGAPVLSSDGRFVAFRTIATVFGASASAPQIVFIDRASGAQELITVAQNGQPSSGANLWATPRGISNDGRFVTFESTGADLTPNDTNASIDVFVRDRLSGATTLLARMADGSNPGTAAGGEMTWDGRWIAIETSRALVASDTNASVDVYLLERSSGALVPVSVDLQGLPAGDASNSLLSADGRKVVFRSASPNLIAADTNGMPDVFVRDLDLATTQRASEAPDDTELDSWSQPRGFSANGRFVAFETSATNALPGYTRGVYLADLERDLVYPIVLGNSPFQVPLDIGPVALSADGRQCAFISRDALTAGDGNSTRDVFVRDIAAGVTRLVSAKPDGTASGANAEHVALSADGRAIVFSSRSGALTSPPIANGALDVFVRECSLVAPQVFCAQSPTANHCFPTMAWSGIPSASSGAAFDVLLTHARSHKLGLLFYGTNGATLGVLGHSLVCVRPPTVRTSLHNSGGTPGVDDCSGALAYDFNARIASGVDPALAVGAVVRTQFWLRDWGAASTYLSEALAFSIEP